MTSVSAQTNRATMAVVVSLCAAGALFSIAAGDPLETNGLTVHNKGIGGQNTEQGRARFEKDVVALKSDFVFISQLTGKETIVCLGDSVTYGSGSKTAGTAEGDTYPAFLQQLKTKACDP